MYRQQQDASAGVEQHYQFSAGSSNFNYSPFSNGMTGMIDFQGTPQHLSPRPITQVHPVRHQRHLSNESMGMQRAVNDSLSPRMRHSTPVRNHFTPTDRHLPSREIIPDTITDAYVTFILYCNPNIALNADTTTLSTNFQTPPKSGDKVFETFRLFELIQKLDSKEIKTWGELALELGVEAPDVSKGQSAQKVQQYSVRLKRWMRAMHVDAFFDYLSDKQHPYFVEIPHPSDPYPANGRDGVLAEEDLAIRALNPAFRPKRGRRRNSEADQEDAPHEDIDTASQVGNVEDPSLAYSANPVAIMPFSRHQNNASDPWVVASAVTPQSFAPWMQKPLAPQTAITTSAPSHLRWQLHGNAHNPSTPHPMTALPTSMNAHIDAAFDNDPRSAVTPSARKRRKHGPAVSSAWPSTNGPGAKPRGRPPASRNVQDGPFSTFPVDPNNTKAPAPTFTTPVAQMQSKTSSEEYSTPPARPAVVSRKSEGSSKLGRLSLQVPKHTGGPVRLATPPRVLVNGETNDSEDNSIGVPVVESPTQLVDDEPRTQMLMHTTEREVPGFAFEALKRVLASDLLRADLTGRRHRLNGDEAKRLADAILERLNVPRLEVESSRDDIARLTAASWLGVGEQLNVPLGPAAGQNKKITVTRFRIGPDGYEELASTYDDSPGHIRELFDLSWNVSMGGCRGNFELKGISISDSDAKEQDAHDYLLDVWKETATKIGMSESDMNDQEKRFRSSKYINKLNAHGTTDPDGIDWKSRYQALEFGARMAKGECDRYKQRVIEKLLDALI